MKKKLRRLLPSSGILLVGVLVSSHKPMNKFVGSGNYARMVSEMADCSRTYIPDTPLPETITKKHTWLLAGPEENIYKAILDTAGKVIYEHDDSEAGQIAGVAVDLGNQKTVSKRPGFTSRYSDQFRSIAVMNTRTAAGCTRLVITAPRTMAVGITEGGVDGEMRTRGILPKDHQLSGIIRVFQNGRPVPGARVDIWITAKGQWNMGGQGPAHDHVRPDAKPSVQIVDYPGGKGDRARLIAAGTGLSNITNSQGEMPFGLQPGYRGGAERVWAKWVGAPAGADSALGSTVFIRFGNLVQFANYHNFSSKKPPRISPAYPYLLVGETDQHKFAHYMQADAITELDRGLMRLWGQEMSPQQEQAGKENPSSGSAHWFQLNDMSLEYGGIFRVDVGSSCADPNNIGRGHVLHNIGLDVDMAPCYSSGMTKISGGECDPTKHKVINRERLRAIIEGELKGVLLKHSGKGPSGVGHYHARLPGAGARARSR